MSVSAPFDRGDVDIHSIEECCEKDAAVVSLNVYEHGVIASVKETALLKTGTANNAILVFELLNRCCAVMHNIIGKRGK